MKVIRIERGTFYLSLNGSTNFSRQEFRKINWSLGFSTFKTLIFDDVINGIWWRHKNWKVMYNIYLCQMCNKMAKFGGVWKNTPPVDINNLSSFWILLQGYWLDFFSILFLSSYGLKENKPFSHQWWWASSKF